MASSFPLWDPRLLFPLILADRVPRSPFQVFFGTHHDFVFLPLRKYEVFILHVIARLLPFLSTSFLTADNCHWYPPPDVNIFLGCIDAAPSLFASSPSQTLPMPLNGLNCLKRPVPLSLLLRPFFFDVTLRAASCRFAPSYPFFFPSHLTYFFCSHS